MTNAPPFPLRLVDARTLDRSYRDVLMPGATVSDHRGIARVLPRYFYEIESWHQASETRLSRHFTASEFIHTDVREAAPLRVFPRYIPCATTLLAVALELIREALGSYVYIGANGGYCSPRHARVGGASPHCWGTAANIYRIGDTYLDDADTIAKYAEIVREIVPTIWSRPNGPDLAMTNDHLHIDLGYVVSVPREAVGETFNLKLTGDPL